MAGSVLERRVSKSNMCCMGLVQDATELDVGAAGEGRKVLNLLDWPNWHDA